MNLPRTICRYGVLVVMIQIQKRILRAWELDLTFTNQAKCGCSVSGFVFQIFHKIIFYCLCLFALIVFFHTFKFAQHFLEQGVISYYKIEGAEKISQINQINQSECSITGCFK